MQWLIEIRKRKSLSQREIAENCAISRQYYNFIEHGRRRPSPDVTKKIATVLGFADE